MRYKCNVCEWIYDEEKEEIPFPQQPESYTCPICGAEKKMFSET